MQKNKGISLIVLVITIIVMIILAGSIIITLSNSGIIQKSNEAVEQTNLATVKELTQTAWASAYAGGDRELAKLQAAVDKALADNKVDKTKYVVEVTTKGVDVVLKGPWVQTGEKITDGKITIKVGEKINYTATGTNYSGEWKALGASKYGELLIMSDSDVATHRLGYKSTTTDKMEKLKETQNSWLNGPNELDEICESYGKGTGATGARSVTLEDIDRVTGYDPVKEKYAEGEFYEYGNEITYKYNGTTKPAYSTTNDLEDGKLPSQTNGFHYYDGTNFVEADLSKSTGIITTLKSDYYGYGLSEGNIELTEAASKLIFGEYDSNANKYLNYYWLANQFLGVINDGGAHYGMQSVELGKVYGFDLWGTNGWSDTNEYGVRAVVSLDIDANISANIAGGWNIEL